jgi:hypothetical protein
MARISSYPIDATPTLSDKVVGSDVNDFNATKNYTIGDILSLGSFNTLSATKMWYGNASAQPVETTVLTYVFGGLGTVPNDTIAFNGATFLGDFTSINDDTSIVLGKGAANITTSNNESVYLGVKAGGNSTLGWNKNVVIGFEAQFNQVFANNSVSIGYQAQSNQVGGLNDVAIGSQTGQSFRNNCFINTIIGSNSFNDALNSIQNQFSYNTIVGSEIGQNTINGGVLGVRFNTAIGYQSFTVQNGTSTATFEGATENVFIGNQSGENLTPENPAVAWTSDRNTAIGYNSFASSSGDDNVAIGVSALRAQHGSYNIGIGVSAGSEYLTGDDDNISIGSRADAAPTIAPGVKQRNISIGRNSRFQSNAGIDNIAIGSDSQYANQAEGNVTVGPYTMSDVTGDWVGEFNTGVGYNALANTRDGGYNATLGADAGRDIVDGSYNTAVGNSAGNTLPTALNTTCLGNEATALGDNEVVLGNGFVTTLRCNTPVISAISDQRDKTNIQPLSLGIDFLMDLNPVSWDWDRRDNSMQGYKDVGFVAQELDSVRSEYSVEDILHKLVDKTNADQYWAAPSVLIPVLVKAIQELKAEINELKNGTN